MTFWGAPSHHTKFQPNRWRATNALLDILEKPLLSMAPECACVNETRNGQGVPVDAMWLSAHKTYTNHTNLTSTSFGQRAAYLGK